MSMAQESIINTKFQIQLRKILDEDNRDCHDLIEAYNAVAASAQKNILVQEHCRQFEPNFHSIVEEGISDLKEVDRPILVIGETSAGKSSFLNLLIGREILPERTAPCTHCVCCIRKGTQLEAHVSLGNGYTPREDEIINDDRLTDAEFRDKLKRLVKETVCSEAPERCINILVPSDMIEGNVYFVDTPGFAENEQVTKSLVKYLPKAIGIIFIINSTVNYGVTSDRVVLILNEITKLIKKGKMRSFDPQNVVFIANKWDQVKEDERIEHFEETLEKMKVFWPHFQEDHLLPLSVTYVKRKQRNPNLDQEDYGKAMLHYQNVLDHVQSVIHHCANARSSAHRRYIKKVFNFLKTCLDAVESVSQSASEEKGNKEKTPLQTFVKDLESTYKQGNETLNKFCETRTVIAKGVHQYLHDPANRETIFPWKQHELPTDKNILFIQLKACDLIQKMISRAIDKLVAEHKAQTDVGKHQLLEHQLKIEKQKAKIECILKIKENNDALAQDTLVDFLTENIDDDLSTGAIVAIAITSPLWIPLGIVSLITVVPVAAAVLKIKERYDVSQFKKNKEQKLREWSNKILKHMYTLDALEQTIFEKEITDARQQLENCSKSVGMYKLIMKQLDRMQEAEFVENGYAPVRQLCSQLGDILRNLQDQHI